MILIQDKPSTICMKESVYHAAEKQNLNSNASPNLVVYESVFL
jgi:hypothetical protein